MACSYETWCYQAGVTQRAHKSAKYVSVVGYNGEVTVEFGNERGEVRGKRTREEAARLAPFARDVAATFPEPNYMYTAAPASGSGWREAIYE